MIKGNLNICTNCGKDGVLFINHKEIYGKEYSKWPYIYYCPHCRGLVGTQPFTSKALGRIATKETRQLRKKAHQVFDILWADGLINRDVAYKWLAKKLNLSGKECHIAVMSDDKLNELILLKDEIKDIKSKRSNDVEKYRKSRIRNREQKDKTSVKIRQRKRKKYAR